MLVTISEKSKHAFISAAEKIGTSSIIPEFPNVREDLALWLTANYMMATIIEAGKDGKIYDTIDHSKRKYELWHEAEDGYTPGSGGGFSYGGYVIVLASANVGARLSFNSWDEGKDNANEYPDLWEIIKLNVK
jgi:hypothetical protein